MTTSDPSPPPRADGLLTELAALLEKIRPGLPWHPDLDGPDEPICFIMGGPKHDPTMVLQVRGFGARLPQDDNARFTIAACNAVPSLLALIAAKDERIKAPDARHAPAASPAQEAEGPDLIRAELESIQWSGTSFLWMGWGQVYACPKCGGLRHDADMPADLSHRIGHRADCSIGKALAAQVRRLRAPEQREGWTTVTEDEATWPAPHGALILWDYDNGADRSLRHVGTKAMRVALRHRTPEKPIRWMPWPSPHVGAQEDGLLRDAVEVVAKEISVAAMLAATAGNLKQRDAFNGWADALRATRQAGEGKA